MKVSTRNPVVVGLLMAVLAIAIVGVTGAGAAATHGIAPGLIAAGVVYMVWPELREHRRRRAG